MSGVRPLPPEKVHKFHFLPEMYPYDPHGARWYHLSDTFTKAVMDPSSKYSVGSVPH